MTVPTTAHSEVQGWPRLVKADIDEFVFERKVRVSWANLGTLLGQMVANPYNIYPYDSTGATLISLAYEPLDSNRATDGGSSGKLASYDEAIVTARYSTKGPRYDANIGLYKEELSPYSDVQRIPNGRNLKFMDNSLVGNIDTIAVSGVLYELTKYHLAALPGAWFTARGCVNNGTFTSGVVAASSGHARYLGCNASHTRSMNGDTLWTATLQFAILPRNWNHFFNPRTNAFEGVYNLAGEQVLLIPQASFSF